MNIGDKTSFAIEYEIERVSGKWIFGHLRFWAKGKSIGDWADLVDLGGCTGWLCEFAQSSAVRFEPELLGKSKEDVFKLLYDPVIATHCENTSQVEPPFERVFERFHISELGMSSFNHYDLLLIEYQAGGWQRLLWRDANDMEIHETFLPYGKMQRVAKEFCSRFAEQKRLLLSGDEYFLAEE